MKKLQLVAAVAAGLMVAGHATAAVEANIGVTSDYLWRGVSQSGDSASVSGGLDYSHDSGVYAGTWVGSLAEGSGAETDLYLGYGGAAGDFAYDVGYVYYHYTELDDSDFGELYFNGSYADFGFGVAYTINSDLDNDEAFGEGGLYYNVSYGIDLPQEYSATVTLGHYDLDTSGPDDSYNHVQLDVAKGDFTFTISKAGSDSGDDDTKFVVSWGTTF